MKIEKLFFDVFIWLIAVSVLLGMLTGACTKQQAGSKGGRATFERHGRDHMQKIGKAGAATTWTRYTMKPVNQSQYAMVDRETNQIKAIIGVWTP